MNILLELNSHCIGIKMCCASCMHKGISNEGLRVCKPFRKYVFKTNLCEYWQMDRKLNKAAGRPGGKIKKKDYLKYVARIRALESQRIGEAEAQGITISMLNIKTIRNKYIQQHGEIYMEF